MTSALNGLHWQSPVTTHSPGSRYQVNGAGSGVGFGSVLILSQPEEDAKHNIYWLEYNMNCRPVNVPFFEACIVRLYWPMWNPLPPDPATLAEAWAEMVRWCQGQGVYNFQVLNELDLEHDSGHWPSADYMQQLSIEIRNRRRLGYPLWLGFPGPSGQNEDYLPGHPKWNEYWNTYEGIIDAHYYNNLALHAYGTTYQGLKDYTWAAYWDIADRFPYHPQRFTEYGVWLDTGYGGDRNARAQDYAAYVNWVRSGWAWRAPIHAVHVFIARDSPDWDESPQFYELTDGEVQILTSGVGCVGL